MESDKFINNEIYQKVIKEVYQIIKGKCPNFQAECNELNGNILNIYKMIRR
jgi:hypothetical protein